MDLQAVRHREQTENNAWNVFNRVQESLIRGGYATQNKYIGPDGIERIGYGPRARELKAVRERVQVNTKLWKLAVEKLLTENK